MTEDIASALAAIRARGSFATRLTVGADDLDLEVKNVGRIRFPVPATAARKLIGAARRAPFGWRDRTLVDPQVRDTWEIPAGRLRIDARKWRRTLGPALERIRDELGLPAGGRLRARLDKLLVYEPGQFFVRHQDSERADDMIGTLAVVLPSACEGGALKVVHGGEQVTCRIGGGRADRLTLIAFYGDCRHEVRPVKKGHRIVLTYRLLFDGAAPGADALDERLIARLGAHVDAHFRTPRRSRYQHESAEPPDRLVYLLDHEYSQRSLRWERLKNADALRAAALRAVAARLDCEIHLALADVHEVWSCDVDDGYYWRRRRHDLDDDDGDEDVDERYEPVDLIDSDIVLRHWIDETGRPAKGLDGIVTNGELCWTTPSVDLEPLRSEYEGWMGNYGNTVERWYHRAAVILWPRSRAFVVRAKLSPAWALDELDKRLRAGEREQARRQAQALLPFWNVHATRDGGKGVLVKALRVAGGLQDPKLAAALLAPFRLRQLGARAMPQLVALLDQHGAAWCRELLSQWARDEHLERAADDPDWLAFMPRFCRELCERAGETGRGLARWVAARQWSGFRRDCEALLRDAADPAAREKLQASAARLLPVLEAADACGAGEVRAEAVKFLAAADGGYPPERLVPILRAARARYAPQRLRALGLGDVYRHCADALAARLAAPARDPDDWSIAPPMACTCELCRELGRFLAARERTRCEWPLAQDKRRHLHGQIDRYALPVTHHTRRQGRPFTLVLAKTEALFAREAELRRALQRDLAWLRRQRRAFLGAGRDR